MASVTTTLDTSGLDRLISGLPERTDDAMGRIADASVSDMRVGMSAESPSFPGDPPGVDTGFLVGSIHAEHDNIGEWSVRGAGYGPDYLEDGTIKMAARPFIRPSTDRVREQVPDLVKGIADV